MNDRFWEHTALADMSMEQWESLCDGCARCCMHKLEDEDTGEVVYTDVACKLLDLDTCRCTDYAHRQTRVADCFQVSMNETDAFRWLPDTCAYRLLFEGDPLYSWHPLISGTPTSVVDAGISVRNQCVSERYIHPDEISLRQSEQIACSPLKPRT